MSTAENIIRFLHIAKLVPYDERWKDWTPPAPYTKAEGRSGEVQILQLPEQQVVATIDDRATRGGGPSAENCLTIGNSFTIGNNNDPFTIRENLRNSDFRKIHFQNIDFSDCAFDNSRFGSNKSLVRNFNGFGDCQFRNTSFRNADLTNICFNQCKSSDSAAEAQEPALLFHGAQLASVWFRLGNWTTLATDFSAGSKLENVVFSGDNCDYSGLEKAKLHRVIRLKTEYFTTAGGVIGEITRITDLTGNNTYPESFQVEMDLLFALAFGEWAAEYMYGLNTLLLSRYFLMPPGIDTWTQILRDLGGNRLTPEYAYEVVKAIWTLGIR